jgi:hypothetical protein
MKLIHFQCVSKRTTSKAVRSSLINGHTLFRDDSGDVADAMETLEASEVVAIGL